MTDGLRSRVNRPSEKFSQLSFTARKGPLVYAPSSCWKYRYDTQPMLRQPDERLFRHNRAIVVAIVTVKFRPRGPRKIKCNTVEILHSVESPGG